MGIKFGEIDSTQILKNEFKIGYLEKIIKQIMNDNPGLNTPSQEDIEEIHKKVIEDLKEKYPNSGIEYKGVQDDE